MNTLANKKSYVVVAFYLYTEANTNGMFRLGEITEDEFSKTFGICISDYVRTSELSKNYYSLRDISKLVNNIINNTSYTIISVSEDDYSIKYHFLAS